MVMAVFAYIYHQSFVVPESLSVDKLLDQVKKITVKEPTQHNQDLLFGFLMNSCLLQIITNLTLEEQQALFMKLGQVLQEKVIGS